MNIKIIGGGPAGMYFAILMKKSDPSHDITIYERNGPDDTFGWGVVFSGKTLQRLRDYDAPSYESIKKEFATWENVAIVRADATIPVHGNSFAGLQRLAMLKILQHRCEELGVTIHFRTEITDPTSLGHADLILAADGVNSVIRKKYEKFFEPTISVRPNKYIWYGTHQMFHALTLTFRESSDGLFCAHSYKFNSDTSTFIIECDLETWTNAGFSAKSEIECADYLQKVFAPDLGGYPLLSNKSTWLNFQLITNKHWYHDNIVLLGDALRTAHFSIGSGTKLALDDSIALFEAVRDTFSIEDALKLFVKRRKPEVQEYLASAYDSLLWFEHAKDYMHLDAVSFAYAVMMRSKRFDHENLRKRDPEFVAQYEAIKKAEPVQ
jgi:anthraniloyl-CoA monooxygenase